MLRMDGVEDSPFVLALPRSVKSLFPALVKGNQQSVSSQPAMHVNSPVISYQKQSAGCKVLVSINVHFDHFGHSRYTHPSLVRSLGFAKEGGSYVAV